MFNNRKVGLIIPTRYGSERLNGKVLQEINGKKQIERIIERALHSQYIDGVYLAITDKIKENKEILDWVKDYRCGKLFYHIGAHDNITVRCLETAVKYNIDIIVDTSHDCSFFDPLIADALIERLFQYNADYSSNCVTRTFPDGFDIQVYTRKIYEKIYCSNEYYKYYSGWNIFFAREKVYPKPRIINLECSPDMFYPEWHLCLDTELDLILIEHMYKFFEDSGNYLPHYYEIIEYLKNNQELLLVNKSVIPTELLQEKI